MLRRDWARMLGDCAVQSKKQLDGDPHANFNRISGGEVYDHLFYQSFYPLLTIGRR
jgi:hypothetical protein